MKANIYLQYYNYNKGFENDIYSSSEDYISAMQEEYAKTSDDVFNVMSKGLLRPKTAYFDTNGSAYAQVEENALEDEKMAFSKASADLFDINGDDMSVDDMIRHFAMEDKFVALVSIDQDSMEEEFEGELKMWLDEYEKISSYEKKMGMEWCLNHTPIRDLKVSFMNSANEEVFGMLSKCLISSIVDDTNIILVVNKFYLIDN